LDEMKHHRAGLAIVSYDQMSFKGFDFRL
jgi:hypothetical protein